MFQFVSTAPSLSSEDCLEYFWTGTLYEGLKIIHMQNEINIFFITLTRET